MQRGITKQQKDRITQFRDITGATEKVATECLKTVNWTVEAAIDVFFANSLGVVAAPRVDAKAIDKLFTHYKDKEDDIISAEGIMKFCEDLGVEPADVVMLVIAHHMGAAHMGEFSSGEFKEGMMKMGADSMSKLQKRLPDLRAELASESSFRAIYNYAYDFAREKGQKCVHQETAIAMWQILFPSERPWPLLEEWCEYLKKHHNKAISKDTWTQLLDFIRTVKPNMSNFDGENSAWPYLIDEFVDHVRSKAA